MPAKRSPRIIKQCIVCGKDFEVIEAQQHKFTTCSAECKSRKTAQKNALGVEWVKKVCPGCGKSFSILACRKDLQTYCTPECRHSANPQVKQSAHCVSCGKQFYYYPSNERGLYCSQVCRRSTQKSGVEKVCLYCGKSFTTKKDATFCSGACGSRYSADANVRWRFCQHCGKKFRSASGTTYNKFCSKECDIASHYVDAQCAVCGDSFQYMKSQPCATCSKCRRKYTPGVIDPVKKEIMCNKIAKKARERMSDPVYVHEIQRKRLDTTKGWKMMSKCGYREDIGVWVRSTWEANFIRWMNYMGIAWEYEPSSGRFEVVDAAGVKSFVQLDFYLPTIEEFVEVKGWMDPKRKPKYDLLKEQYPDVTVVWIGKEEYANIMKEFIHKIPNMEGPTNCLAEPKPLATCLMCGEQFLQRVKTNKFCSRSCWGAFRAPADKLCHVCGKSFTPRKKSQRCCSHVCRNKFLGDEGNIYRLTDRIPSCSVRPLLKKECIICHKEFSTRRAAQVCCSVECKNAGAVFLHSRNR